MKIIKSMFSGLKELINRIEFSVVKLDGHDVILPTYIRFVNVYGIGLQKLNLPMVIILSCIQVFVLFGEFYYAFSNWGNTDMFYGLSSGLYGSRAVFVTINFVYRYESIRKMLAIYAKEIWISKEKDPKGRAKCEASLFGHRIVGYATIPAVAFFTFEPLYKTFIIQDGSKKFSLGVDYPVDVRAATWRYVFVAMLTFTALLFRAIFIANFNMLLNYMLMNTCYRLEEQKNILLTANEMLDDYAYNKKIIGVVKVHQKLVSFTHRVQSIFTLGIFVQFGLDSLIVCSIGIYFLFADLTIGEYCKVLWFCFIAFSQLPANCISGERLIQTSLQLGDAAYHSDWPKRHLKRNPSLQLLILRAQHPLKITGLNFFELSMTMFASVCKRTMSYFTLIKTFFE